MNPKYKKRGNVEKIISIVLTLTILCLTCTFSFASSSINMGGEGALVRTSTSLNDKAYADVQWESRVKENFKNKYWYRLGYKGMNTDYMQIGGNGEYQITLSDLSEASFEMCEEYRKQVDSCKEYYTKYKRQAYGTMLGAIGATALIALNIVFPATVVVDGALAIIVYQHLDFVEDMVNNYKMAKSSYKNLTNNYELIKSFGEKL